MGIVQFLPARDGNGRPFTPSENRIDEMSYDKIEVPDEGSRLR